MNRDERTSAASIRTPQQHQQQQQQQAFHSIALAADTAAAPSD